MEPKYLIWSFRHHAWWKHNAGGYTLELRHAGRYTAEEALSYGLDPVDLSEDKPSGDALLLEY
jgi:hypothetical protein